MKFALHTLLYVVIRAMKDAEKNIRMKELSQTRPNENEMTKPRFPSTKATAFYSFVSYHFLLCSSRAYHIHGKRVLAVKVRPVFHIDNVVETTDLIR